MNDSTFPRTTIGDVTRPSSSSSSLASSASLSSAYIFLRATVAACRRGLRPPSAASFASSPTTVSLAFIAVAVAPVVVVVAAFPLPAATDASQSVSASPAKSPNSAGSANGFSSGFSSFVPIQYQLGNTITLSNHSSRFILSFDFAFSVKYRVDFGRTMLPSIFIRPPSKSKYTTGACVCISRISPILPSLLTLSCPGNTIAYRAFFAALRLWMSFPSRFSSASDASSSCAAVAGRVVDIIFTRIARSCGARIVARASSSSPSSDRFDILI